MRDKLRTVVEKRMREACQDSSAVEAESLLTALARELDRTHPGAAASLREGMAETLTILSLGVPPTLARTLHSINPIESMIEICWERSKNVKRWRDGQMALRWCAAASTATCTCRNSAPHSNATSPENVSATRNHETVNAA